MEDLFDNPKNGHLLTRAIIGTIREPLIVLNKDLRVLVASPSFYETFKVLPSDTEGKLLYELGDGQWDIPALRDLLKGIIPDNTTMDGFEVECDFPTIGKRTMLLSSREIRYENGEQKSLLTMYDVTNQKALQLERERLIHQKDLLLKEMRHRIANSLQLIASILLLKAGIVESEETRFHLNDAHERIMSIATVQRQLDPGGAGDDIKVGAYLTELCKSVARSIVGGRRAITVEVIAGPGTVSSEVAITLGLLTTELVINAVKHAFPHNREGVVVVSYTSQGEGWTLSVADNGIGHSPDKKDSRHGLGTSIVAALMDQLNATTKTESSSRGTKVYCMYAGSPTKESQTNIA